MADGFLERGRRMRLVVWVNGPFGVGKTTVAEKVVERWPEALMFDPEQVGTMLRAILPRALHRDDYQDEPVWRRLVVRTALELLSAFERPLIVPMALVVPSYFDEIVGGLRSTGVHVEHFTLLATPSTVVSRLVARAHDEEWAAAQLARCLPALRDAKYAAHVDTEHATADDVADRIVARLTTPP